MKCGAHSIWCMVHETKKWTIGEFAGQPGRCARRSQSTYPIDSQSDGAAIAGLLRGNRLLHKPRGRAAAARVTHNHAIAASIPAPGTGVLYCPPNRARRF